MVEAERYRQQSYKYSHGTHHSYMLPCYNSIKKMQLLCNRQVCLRLVLTRSEKSSRNTAERELAPYGWLVAFNAVSTAQRYHFKEICLQLWQERNDASDLYLLWVECSTVNYSYLQECRSTDVLQRIEGGVMRAFLGGQSWEEIDRVSVTIPELGVRSTSTFDS